MLEPGIYRKETIITNIHGAPQGGIISPTIMNMDMDGLETALKKGFSGWKRQKVKFIPYADDFIITASSEELIKNEIIPLVVDFLEMRGLKLPEEKSKIIHITDGFDFLSQNIRKYKGKLGIDLPKNPSSLSKTR